MDHLIVFDDKEKKKIGIISLIPNVAFFISLLYYLFQVIPVASADHLPPASVVATTAAHYDTLFWMLAASATIAAGVLIYELVLLTRMKNMNGAEKLIWVLILASFVPLSFVAFWFFVIRKEPKYVGMYPDII